MDKAKELAKFALQLGIVIFITFLIPVFIGLSKGGLALQEIIDQQMFYVIFIAYPIGLLCFKIFELFIVKGDAKYGSSVGFASLGQKPHNNFFKRFTIPQIALLSLIIFGFLGLMNYTWFSETAWGQKTYTGVKYLQAQQFTKLDSLIYSTSLVAGSENLQFALMIAVLMVGIGIWARRTNMSFTEYSLLVLVSSMVLGGLFGLGNHLLRYSGFDTALMIVFFFWAIGGLITALTGSFFPFWIMHGINNLFYDMGRNFADETITIIVSFALIALSALYYFQYKGRLLGGSKYEKED